MTKSNLSNLDNVYLLLRMYYVVETQTQIINSTIKNNSTSNYSIRGELGTSILMEKTAQSSPSTPLHNRKV